LEPFYPDRLASRILGMGDVLSLIERAQAEVEEQKAKELEKKLRKATFDLQDFLEQLRTLRRMGSLTQLLEMVPGFSQMKHRLSEAELDERQIKRIEAIILSMTPAERRHVELLDGSRKRRVARGSGTTVQEVNQLLNQFRDMQRLMKQMTHMKGRRGLPGMLRM
ncbi:MAG: signal recognition particle protein, partial [Chloroflexi bacterium]|nr:signal recognition particle protein [Chloroflexota bacterium]